MSLKNHHVVLLREGTDHRQGKTQLITNINACIAITDVLRSTLGPKGLDKLILDSKGNATITNDGATILGLLEIVHPAAKILADIAGSLDAEVGDGTTTVVLLAGEFLLQAKYFLNQGIHPRLLMRIFRRACNFALTRVRKSSTCIVDHTSAVKLHLLERCAATSMDSKLVSTEKKRFAKMVVKAVCRLDSRLLDLRSLGVKKLKGGSLSDSMLIDGVVIEKTFSYAGFEQLPKKFYQPLVLCLNIELELKAEVENAEIRLSDTMKYQKIIDTEWNIIYNKLDACAQSGAKVIFSRCAIGDLSTQYFADRGIFCAGRIADEDLARLAEATGAILQTTISDLDISVLGKCTLFEEKSFGDKRYNIFTGCPNAHTATFLLRGGSEQFIDEVHRSLNDAIMIVRKMFQHPKFVPGGGAIDMNLSKYIREQSVKFDGKDHFITCAYAKAFEIVPRQLCENAGLDTIETLNKLRLKHYLSDMESQNFGVNVNTGYICNMFKNFILEPTLVKINVLYASTEASCIVLGIDETIRNQNPDDKNQ